VTALLTADEVAALLKVSTKTIRRRLASGELRGIRIRGCVRVSQEAVDEWRQRAMVGRPRRGGSVYFVRGRATGLVKIGQTNDVDRRLRALQANSPDALELLGVIRSSEFQEAELHGRFARFRLHNEWFRPTPILLAFIAEHAT
jgi:excisionase family DNA binding protein